MRSNLRSEPEDEADGGGDPVADPFAGDGAPGFTIVGWTHVLAGMVVAVTVIIALTGLAMTRPSVPLVAEKSGA